MIHTPGIPNDAAAVECRPQRSNCTFLQVSSNQEMLFVCPRNGPKITAVIMQSGICFWFVSSGWRPSSRALAMLCGNLPIVEPGDVEVQLPVCLL